MNQNSNKLSKLYFKLRRRYGRPQGQWQLWCKRPKTEKEKEEVIIGAILTQRTTWKNVERAINNLKRAKANSLKGILKNKNKLVLLTKPSGFKNQKAKYLINVAEFIVGKYGGASRMAKEPFRKLRQELLTLKGIGPETADSILLYAFEKPVFVIDEYTRRLLTANRLLTTANSSKRKYSYENIRQFFEVNLPRSWRLYQDFHALIVIDGKKKPS